ncbi:hypothetical protein GEMRC1_006025 [Eukaryota sp. GEM-RC1]
MNIRLQSSLLVLSHTHLLRHLLKSSLVVHCGDSSQFLVDLLCKLPTFILTVGHVSQRFLDSAVLAVRCFFNSTTVPLDPEHFPLLTSLISFFGAKLTSVHLNVGHPFHLPMLHNYTSFISELGLSWYYGGFLNEFHCLSPSSSLFFSGLKRLTVTDILDCVAFSDVCKSLMINSTIEELNLAFDQLSTFNSPCS